MQQFFPEAFEGYVGSVDTCNLLHHDSLEKVDSSVACSCIKCSGSGVVVTEMPLGAGQSK